MHANVKPIRMTNKAKVAAKGLAVAYSTYLEHMRDHNESGVAVWADILARRQRECGVEIIDHATLEHLVYCVNTGKPIWP
jgi:hypothetical protein